MSQEIRPYQMDQYRRVREAAAHHRIIVVQGATGCGKTTWAAYTTQQAVAKEKRVLFLVHRRRLVDQICRRLAEFGITHGVIMRDKGAYGPAPVQVGSRDTILSRCFTHEWTGLPPADLVIVDEGHHAAKPDSEYRRILEQYPKAKILLLTATPVGPDGEGMGPWAEALVCAAPPTELIRDGYLMPVTCKAPRRKRKGNKFLRGIAGDLVESWKQYAEDRPTVLFCSRVQHSQDAVQAFMDAGITAKHVDADTPDDERDLIFDEVADGRIKVLANVGIVGEGVDVPELGCVQFFCEVRGRVKFLQGCGRVMRPSPGKSYGIIIDHSGAVFEHGFPDEDTPWTLEGNADADFAAKRLKGETAMVNYCQHCALLYHDSLNCPQCGRTPRKPPKPIFAPPPMRPRDEMLTEAERGQYEASDLKWKTQTWLACLGTAKKRNGNFLMASAIYKEKCGEYPPDDFPLNPGWSERRKKISEVYPDFGKRK